MSTETPHRNAPNDVDHTDDPVPPMLVSSLEAFRRDLPRLLETHYRKWVAYHGDEQIGFGTTETELYEKGFARGLKPDEFLVCSIEPEIPDEEITWSYGF
jgi:hypothetical protein